MRFLDLGIIDIRYDRLVEIAGLGSNRTSCHGAYLAISLSIKIRSVPYTRP